MKVIKQSHSAYSQEGLHPYFVGLLILYLVCQLFCLLLVLFMPNFLL